MKKQLDFVHFAINQRRRKEEHVKSDPKLRDRLESASDTINPVIINKRMFPNYFAIDYPELNLFSENPETPHLMECMAYFLDADILVLEATEDGGKYAIVEHFSPAPAVLEGANRSAYFMVKLYGQFWVLTQ